MMIQQSRFIALWSFLLSVVSKMLYSPATTHGRRRVGEAHPFLNCWCLEITNATSYHIPLTRFCHTSLPRREAGKYSHGLLLLPTDNLCYRSGSMNLCHILELCKDSWDVGRRKQLSWSQRILRFSVWLYPFGCHFTFLSLSFLVCKMEIMQNRKRL